MDGKNTRKIGAVILAAGLSKRMNTSKQFLLLNGVPLFIHAVSLASECGLEPIILVIGENEGEYEKYLVNYPNVIILKNECFREGMGTSLRLGVQFVNDQVEAIMIFLADQPFVTKEVVMKMVNKYHELGVRPQYTIIRPKYKNMEGHPILFDVSLFPEFNFLEGDKGGKSIIKKYRKYLKIINFDKQIYGFDIDTPEEYLIAKRYRGPF
ncbi:nucleotidyltransferase family protein [Bacillus sp. 1NLA3E]|uniref:nucleotidyltransferase family protein n=1 Tax=Bacillus sp. 1NLA3E TaxID=666686 RepID=UPI000247E5C9|nr:nucleotidyltransferase family protein [Bacillus sp. 1NLA3E]AGK52254.1 4-diphosphocytidyl-2C-methyl-D-erythritol synthase [Bacillus sp. 1NLA3E]